MSAELSIIIPCYNGATSITKLQSSLDRLQPQPNIIFVDDGSTDNSKQVIQEFFPNAQYLYQNNAGVAAARNTGAKKAHTEYLLFLDCDDTLNPKTLWKRIAFAQENNLDVLTSSWRMEIRSHDQVTLENIRYMDHVTDPVEALLKGSWWGPPHAYIIKRSAYWEIDGADETLINAQDFDVWIRLAIAYRKWGFCKDLCGHYVRDINQSSLARGPRKQYWADTHKVVNKAIQSLKTEGALTAERQTAAAYRLHSAAKNIYSIDVHWYKQVIAQVKELAPAFTPEGTRLYQITAQMLGLEKADKIAHLKRAFKKLFKVK